MKYLSLFLFCFLSLNTFTQNDFEIHKNKNFTIIKVLNKKNNVIKEFFIDAENLNKKVLERKIDSIISSYKDKQKGKVVFSNFVKNLNKLDTIFIYFKNGRNEIKKTSSVTSEKLNSGVDYQFNFSNNNSFTFTYSEFLNQGFSSQKSDLKLKPKSFINNQREDIVTFNALEKHHEELEQIFSSFQGKTIYLIDCMDTKKDTLTLRQVNLLSNLNFKE